jgi:hypothetical protein
VKGEHLDLRAKESTETSPSLGLPDPAPDAFGPADGSLEQGGHMEGYTEALRALEAEFGPRTGKLKHHDEPVGTTYRTDKRIKVVEGLRTWSLGQAHCRAVG